MTRSRSVVLVSFVVVAVGLVVALGAFYFDPARAAVGPLPAEGLALPANSRYVMGVDVKRLTASPFYKKYSTRTGAAQPQAFTELRDRAGIDPERDVDQIVAAGAGDKGPGVVLVLGRFDREKVRQALQTRKTSTRKEHQGSTIYLFENPSQRTTAFALLDARSLAVGSVEAVEGTITNRTQSGASLKSNATLIGLLEQIKPGSTFWMVGDQSVLSNMIPVSVSLPQLKSLMVTGDLDPVVAVDVTGEASDEAGAKNLADMVRGFVALASLQAQQKPQLQALSTAINVTTEGPRVRVSGRFTYELLDALQPAKPAPPTPPPAPAQPPAVSP